MVPWAIVAFVFLVSSWSDLLPQLDVSVPEALVLLSSGCLLSLVGVSRLQRRTERGPLPPCLESNPIQDQLRSLTQIQEINRSLTSSLDLDVLLPRLAELTAQSLELSALAVLLRNAGGEFVINCAWGKNPGWGEEGAQFPKEKCDWLLRKMGKDDSFSFSPREIVSCFEDWKGSAEGAVQAFPMRVHDGILGLLLLHREESSGFFRREVDFVGSVAGHAALAIANARLYDETRRLSITDPLTGLYNRRHLEHRMELEVARAKRTASSLTVAIIDVDHFKLLNDAAGHSIGDRVLVQVAEVLQRTIRKTDLVARQGGEEFCVVFPDLPKAKAYDVVEKLRSAVCELPLPEGLEEIGQVTISIGVASYDDDATELEPLLDAADAALYASKRGGRNRTTLFRRGMEVHPNRERGAAKGKEVFIG